MEPIAASAAAHTRQVIELAIEETVVYDLTWKIRIKYPWKQSVPTRVTPQLLGQKKTAATKERPVAKVLPAIRERKRSDTKENDLKGDTIEDLIKPLVIADLKPEPVSVYICTTGEGNENLPNQNITEETAQVQVQDVVLDGEATAGEQENTGNLNKEGNILKEAEQGEDTGLEESKSSVEKEQENQDNLNWERKFLQESAQEAGEEQENREVQEQEDIFLREAAQEVGEEQKNREVPKQEGISLREAAQEFGEEQGNHKVLEQEGIFLREAAQEAGEEQENRKVLEHEGIFLREAAQEAGEEQENHKALEQEGTSLKEAAQEAGEQQENREVRKQEGIFLREAAQEAGEEQENHKVLEQEGTSLKEAAQLDDIVVDEKKSAPGKKQEFQNWVKSVLCKSSLKLEDQVEGRRDPCACHRNWVREEVRFATKKKATGVKAFCNMECVDGQGCHAEGSEIGENHQKETLITDCLEEFLKGLHLTHLLDYLKVLGCMCVRDLRLLEMPELEAIQLISRRRLLKQLDSLSLHHEAPPEGCSLEAWLTWYGLTHISGFLTAIGVHSVGDLQYLSEEDLLLLKPVTRRRILACHKKCGEKGRMLASG